MAEIEFSEWQKFDLRVGQIKEVNDHPNADKLYVMKVDIGEKTIQLVAGIKPYYPKEKLVNKKIIVFTNLKPKDFRGVMSEGMLLAADGEDVGVLTVDKDSKVGSKIR